MSPGRPTSRNVSMLRLLAGRVELQRDGVVAAVLLPGDSFGELSVIHRTPRPGRALVTEQVVVLVLPAETLRAAVQPQAAATS